MYPKTESFARVIGGQAIRLRTGKGVRYTLSQEGDGAFRMRNGRAGALGLRRAPTATAALPSANKHGTQFTYNPRGQLIAQTHTAGHACAS